MSSRTPPTSTQFDRVNIRLDGLDDRVGKVERELSKLDGTVHTVLRAFGAAVIVGLLLVAVINLILNFGDRL